ncbi:hypothetical protein PoB_003213400 [Plakobranchus ocellatus]|uniref:PLAT domain-containing protein n=1 Tax=Plakobranchus ocellatus TaxID=259542 RepID=A0AAV4ADB1_9GAST|nr:hypothetical protein PoB_003213400 [Plakobranchus ocellatus]
MYQYFHMAYPSFTVVFSPTSILALIKDMVVLENNGEVTDSTCIIFSVARSSRINLTLTVSISGSYNYSYAAIDAKYPSEYLGFIGTKFKPIGSHFFYFMPHAPSGYISNYPLSRFIFMVRVPTSAGLHFGPGILSTASSATQPTIPSIQRPRGNASMVPVASFNVVKCHCYVDAVYSAAQGEAMRYYREFKPRVLNYHGPTLIPIIFITLFLLFFMYYCYWSYFQDVRERDCAQIHVVKDMYNPNSSEQYLVCITTGAMPGSGTDKRVSFLLVGESGSFRTVQPTGRFCFSTGSEVWFLLSSDMNLGYITGVTISYDKIVSGGELYPWFLKRVIVYSKSFNHVIEFEANQTLGIHLHSLVLPAVPHKKVRGKETFERFWIIMKSYHLIASVLFHVPGKGASRWQSAVASATVVTAAAALTVEILGPPTPVFHLNVLRSLNTQGYLRAFGNLAGITCCLSLFVKSIYSLMFRKRIGIIWYSTVQSQEIVWTIPEKNEELYKTWLSDKHPLPYEPEVNPKWLIRRLYFPQWVARHLAARAHEKLAEGTEPLARRAEPETEAEPPTRPQPRSAHRASLQQMGAEMKRRSKNTLQFGVGRGVRRLSQASGSTKLSDKSQEQKGPEAPQEASFASHKFSRDKSGSFILSEPPLARTSQDTENAPEGTEVTDSNVNRGGTDPNELDRDPRRPDATVTGSHTNASTVTGSHRNSATVTGSHTNFATLTGSHAISWSVVAGNASEHGSEQFAQNTPAKRMEDGTELGASFGDQRFVPEAGERECEPDSVLSEDDQESERMSTAVSESGMSPCVISPINTSPQDEDYDPTDDESSYYPPNVAQDEQPKAESCYRSTPSLRLLPVHKDAEPTHAAASEFSAKPPNTKRPFDRFTKPYFAVSQAFTSFQEYYFRPVVIKGSKNGQWQKASKVHENVKFLRNSRYLEKLVKDYELDTFLYPHSVQMPDPGGEGRPGSVTEGVGCEDLAFNFSDAEEDTENVGDNAFKTAKLNKQLISTKTIRDHDQPKTELVCEAVNTDRQIGGQDESGHFLGRQLQKFWSFLTAMKQCFLCSMVFFWKLLSHPCACMCKSTTRKGRGTGASISDTSTPPPQNLQDNRSLWAGCSHRHPGKDFLPNPDAMGLPETITTAIKFCDRNANAPPDFDTPMSSKKTSLDTETSVSTKASIKKKARAKAKLSPKARTDSKGSVDTKMGAKARSSLDFKADVGAEAVGVETSAIDQEGEAGKDVIVGPETKTEPNASAIEEAEEMVFPKTNTDGIVLLQTPEIEVVPSDAPQDAVPGTTVPSATTGSSVDPPKPAGKEQGTFCCRRELEPARPPDDVNKPYALKGNSNVKSEEPFCRHSS